MKKYKAALLGYYGFGNLGDELLLKACIELLKDEKIIVLSNNPDDTQKNFGVDAVNRWKISEIMNAFRESEYLIMGGGGIFQDSSSIKSCVWYWAVMRLAKFCGCKIFAIGQSIGPLDSRLSRILAGNALRMCEFIHVRDENSYKLAEKFKCRKIILGRDLVMKLNLKPETYINQKEYMLVNLRPCKNLNKFIKIIAPKINNQKTIGAALSEEDIDALKLSGINEIVRVKNFDDAASLWKNASCAVGMRLHFGVLSRIFRVPVSLMPYDVKVSEFAKQSNISCIIDEWQEPVMPLEIPNNQDKIFS